MGGVTLYSHQLPSQGVVMAMAMDRDAASLATGIVVAAVTGVPSSLFLMGATWSSIHGGMSGMAFAVVTLIAIAVPAASAFFAGRAVYQRWPQRGSTDATDSSSSMSIRVNCPQCGCSMKHRPDYSATTLYTVVECPIHGPFHFGPNTALTLGRPSQR